VTVGFCRHDIEKIEYIEKNFGRMLPIMNPILELRPSDHKTAAHYSQTEKHHGACNVSEAYGELAHQKGKKVARSKNKVPLQGGQRQHEIMIGVASEMNQNV